MSAESARFRVLTWNVHSCIGRRGVFDPDGVAAAVKRLSPDVVALQEIEGRRSIVGDLDNFRYLPEQLGWPAIEARTIRGRDGDYGHLLASRLAVEEGEVIDLAVARHEPRAAVSGIVPVAGARVRVVATHLGLRAADRRQQVRRILDFLKDKSDMPTVLLGDFNEWRRGGLTSRTLCPPFQPAAIMPSFPSWRPLFPLDRIFCNQPLEPLAASTDVQAARLSDHLPVLAVLGLRDGRDGAGEGSG